MTGSMAYARIKADVLAIVAQVPAGHVTTHGDIGRHLQVMPRHIGYVLAMLGEAERETVPWWRVVADGGAIGRHKHRDDQMARLKADGVPLSPVGIVQELAERRVADLAAPPSGPLVRPQAPTDAKPSRSRGMKSHPEGRADEAEAQPPRKSLVQRS